MEKRVLLERRFYVRGLGELPEWKRDIEWGRFHMVSIKDTPVRSVKMRRIHPRIHPQCGRTRASRAFVDDPSCGELHPRYHPCRHPYN